MPQKTQHGTDLPAVRNEGRDQVTRISVELGSKVPAVDPSRVRVMPPESH